MYSLAEAYDAVNQRGLSKWQSKNIYSAKSINTSITFMIQNHSITKWQRSGMNNLYSDQILTATPPHNFLWVGWAIDTSKEFALKRSGCSTSRLHRGHKRQKVDFGPRPWDFSIKNVTTKHCSTWVHIYSVLCLQHTGTHAESNPDQDTSLKSQLLSMNVALLVRYLMYYSAHRRYQMWETSGVKSCPLTQRRWRTTPSTNLIHRC